VSVDNLADFLQLPNVAMAGGSWLTPPELQAQGQWARITELARQASTIAQR
jgi:2-dehydro-3-deoxyphosphogluconate aldolase/(4S)-4-hydroxy-2-oxoglutarate aldolase